MSQNNIDILISAKDQATTTLKKVSNQVWALDKSVSSMWPSWTAIGAIAAGALAAIGYWAMKAVKAYNDVEVINKKLEHAVLDVSHGTREQMQALSDLADEAERKWVVDADSVRLGQAQLSTFGLQTETVKKLTASLVDLTVNQSGATATGADFEASANTIAKALNGQFGILEKSGIRFSEAQKAIIEHGSESQKAAAIQEWFAQNLKYTNEIAATTAEGWMARMNVAIGNVQESIGEALQPAVIEVTNAIASLAEKISAWFSDNKTQVNNTMHYIGAWFGLLVNLVGNTWNALATTIATAIVVVMQTIVNIANAGIKAWNVFASVVWAKGIEPLKWFENAAVKGAVATGNAWGKLGSDFSNDFSNITAWAKKTSEAIGGGGSGSGLSGSIGNASKQTEELRKKAEEAMKAIIDKSKDGKKAIDDVRQAIKDKTKEWIKYKEDGSKALREIALEIKNVADEAKKITIDFWKSKDTKLAERMVQVNQDITEAQKQLNDESDPTLRIELETKLNNLLAERVYIQSNASAQAITDAQNYANLSDSQKIVVDLEKEKWMALEENKAKMDALIEKQMILQAQANQKSLEDVRIFTEIKDGIVSASIIDENWKRQELHSQEAINLAFDVQSKQEAMKKEVEDLDLQLQQKLSLQQINLSTTQDMYAKFNKFLKEDTEKTALAMIETLNDVTEQLQSVIDLRSKAAMSSVDSTTPLSGALANWWPVIWWSTYLVGERGPELFTPRTSGAIVPNNQIGWGVSISINLWGVSVRNDQDIRTMTDMIADELARKLQLNRLWIAA